VIEQYNAADEAALVDDDGAWAERDIERNVRAACGAARRVLDHRVRILDVAAPSAAGALKTNQTVVITGDRIADVGATGRTRVPPSARRIDGRGKFLIPGAGTCTCT